GGNMFIGRQEEILDFERLYKERKSNLVVVYGRRRIGKSSLIDKFCGSKRSMKFEGMEGEHTAEQMSQFQRDLKNQVNDKFLKQMNFSKWEDIFDYITEVIKKSDKKLVLFFDEFQWMAGNRTSLVSQLKYAWDNLFIQHNRVHLVLCGSVSSFMINKVLKSKALYGRVDKEIHLLPLLFQDIVTDFSQKRSVRDIIEIFLLIGGIPKYLELFDLDRSVQLNTVDLFFSPNSYFINEYERLFSSHFGKNKHYETILIFLQKNRWSDRKTIQDKCHLKEGGRTTEYLNNLEQAGFIENYAPVDRTNTIRHSRYRICDPYLDFYFRFLHENKKRINKGTDQNLFLKYLPDKLYYPWRGYAFEKFCYQHEHLIARRLGFGGIAYDAGPWFERNDRERFQIDLAYIRSDRVMTICEIKFMDNEVDLNVIDDFQKRLVKIPNPRKMTIERVLITASAPKKSLVDRGYFHHILTLDNIFGSGAKNTNNSF
ncbi:MAG: AAA family ATPase, partial [Spirochaetales bacterium]|nr:AAA family ATPase [Spirochaetales bacterium]